MPPVATADDPAQWDSSGRAVSPTRVPLQGLRRSAALDDRLTAAERLEAAFEVLHDEGGAFTEARLLAFHRYEAYRPMLALARQAVRRALGMSHGP